MADTFDKDDGRRATFALGISLAEPGDGRLRLVLDDLEIAGDSPRLWKHWAFFTIIDTDAEKAAAHELTREHYAAIGELVLARLLARRAVKDDRDE